jgi:AcrR family transcriptional regulator
MKKRRLSQLDWVKGGLDALVEGGIEAVRIDTLAEKLGVTKGSFYHHFESRDDLLDAMASDWGDNELEAVAEEVSALPGDPKMRMQLVVGIYERRDLARYDRAMRAWAHSDLRAEKAVRKASDLLERLFLQLFDEMGFDDRQSKLRARIVMLCGIGAMFALELPRREDDAQDMREQFFELLTAGREQDLLSAATSAAGVL